MEIDRGTVIETCFRHLTDSVQLQAIINNCRRGRRLHLYDRTGGRGGY